MKLCSAIFDEQEPEHVLRDLVLWCGVRDVADAPSALKVREDIAAGDKFIDYTNHLDVRVGKHGVKGERIRPSREQRCKPLVGKLVFSCASTGADRDECGQGDCRPNPEDSARHGSNMSMHGDVRNGPDRALVACV